MITYDEREITKCNLVTYKPMYLLIILNDLSNMYFWIKKKTTARFISSFLAVWGNSAQGAVEKMKFAW